MYFRQLRLPDIGCASYILGSEGVCAVVDPRWDAVPQYVGLARQHSLRITHIIETHTHADHVSGATRLAARTGATILIHELAQISYPHQDVRDSDEIMLGTVQVKVLHTPGHSLDSISLLVRDMQGDAAPRLLSGDTLFVGEVGRPDLHGTQAAELAQHLHHSLQERVLTLADDVEVYPAHLAGSLCGRRIAPEPSTTIGRERQANSLLALVERDAFVRTVLEDLPPRPPNVERIVQLNRNSAPSSRPKAIPLTPAEFVAGKHEAKIIDGRDVQAFALGHLADAINIPVAYGQFGVMVAWLYPPDIPLLLITNDEEDLVEAIDSLMVVGMTNPLSTLDGGPQDWLAAGLMLIETPQLTVTELAERMKMGAIGTLIDSREIGEMEKGTISGALNLPYRVILSRATLPPLNEPVITLCNSGNRSSVAASLLESLGWRVMNVQGGTTAWIDAGFPLTM